MAYRDLRDFINTLDKKDELCRIDIEVDPVYEITEISDRTVKAGGPALLFERPKGSRVPVGFWPIAKMPASVSSLSAIATNWRYTSG